MTRLAFGGKWSDGRAPLGFREGANAALAPRRSRGKRAPSAMRPSPVVLRARKDRRVRVFSISVWKLITVARELVCRSYLVIVSFRLSKTFATAVIAASSAL